MTFTLTYSTMFDPPAEMHSRFEAALAELRGIVERLAKDAGMDALPEFG